MIYQLEKWFRDRLYEIYVSIGKWYVFFGVCIADIDFEIHLISCRDRLAD